MAHSPNGNTWSKPAAMAIPKEGYHKLENGRYGPLYPRTPANHGFTIIAKVRKGREQAVREYGKTIEGAIAGAGIGIAVYVFTYLWRRRRRAA